MYPNPSPDRHTHTITKKLRIACLFAALTASLNTQVDKQKLSGLAAAELKPSTACQ
jgi:hypothetical protein